MRLFLLLTSLILFGTINAQTFVVDSCKVCPEDSTWAYFPRVDNNGMPCAIVKVFTTNITGKLEFKGNIVGNVIDNNNSYYTIYVLDKTKRLKAYHSEYVPTTIEFSTYEASRLGLKSNIVYYLYISGSSVQTDNQPSVPKGTRVLSFSSNTELQYLSVDGIEWEIIEKKTSKRMIPYGNHNYEAVSIDGKIIKDVVNLQPSLGSKIIKLNFKENGN